MELLSSFLGRQYISGRDPFVSLFESQRAHEQLVSYISVFDETSFNNMFVFCVILLDSNLCPFSVFTFKVNNLQLNWEKFNKLP